jgi:malate dehydrogenase (oxaloacetate-decarboxylating)
VRQFAPTILIGTTATPGCFTETAIREMAARAPVPVVFPLSNPTAKSEATPADVLRWSDGRALVATGSPFDPVRIGTATHLVGQANNVFIFPGVGMGAIVSRATQVTDRMFLAAATTLADLVPAERIRQGALYPEISDLRQVCRAVAVAVAREATDSGVAAGIPGDDIESAVTAAMWTPAYGTLSRGSPVAPEPCRSQHQPRQSGQAL